jgi:hypothetical protein
VYKPGAPPRGTDARTGGPALGLAARSLLIGVVLVIIVVVVYGLDSTGAGR